MSLEIRWIEDLLALERELSISKAAAIRHVTQSAFTRRIQNIEDILGFKVLNRYNKNIEFTDAGQILLGSSKSIQTQLNTTLRYLEKNMSNDELAIKFAISHSLTTQFFPKFIHALTETIDELKIEIIASNVEQGLGLLKDGSCDFLICYCDQKIIKKLGHDLFTFKKVFSVEILPVTINDSRYKSHQLEQHFSLLSYSKQAYLKECVDNLIINKLNYRTLYETDNAVDLKGLVLQGLGVAWLPRLLIENELKEGILRLFNTTQYNFFQDIYLIRNKINSSKKTDYIWSFLNN